MIRGDAKSYLPKVERLRQYSGELLRDDKCLELNRVFGNQMKPAIMVSAEKARMLGLNWTEKFD
jgi:hypothetical protein